MLGFQLSIIFSIFSVTSTTFCITLTFCFWTGRRTFFSKVFKIFFRPSVFIWSECFISFKTFVFFKFSWVFKLQRMWLTCRLDQQTLSSWVNRKQRTCYFSDQANIRSSMRSLSVDAWRHWICRWTGRLSSAARKTIPWSWSTCANLPF